MTVVVGGGLIGLLTAYELVLTGRRKVVVIERHHVGAGASGAGAGILYPLYPWGTTLEACRQAECSAQLYPDLVKSLYQQTGIFCDYRRSGLAILDEFGTQAGKTWMTHNPQATLMSSDLLPTAKIHDQYLLLPHVAQINNVKLIHALKIRLLNLGVEILENNPVQSLLINQNKIKGIRTQTHSIDTSQVIVAAGAFSKHLLKPLGIKLNLHAAKGQILSVQHPFAKRLPMILKDNYYLVPRANDNTLLVGSTYEVDPKHALPDRLGYQQLFEFAQSLLPDLTQAAVTAHWSGLRPCFSTKETFVGPVDTIEGLWLATGHDRLGVTLAPLAAKNLCEQILTSPNPKQVAYAS